MRMCQPHWKQLQQAIKAKGLWDMVAADGREAVQKMTSENANAETFEPLMAAHNMILGAALNMVGPRLMEGEQCPLCFCAETAKTELPERWIAGAAEDVGRLAESIKTGKRKLLIVVNGVPTEQTVDVNSDVATVKRNALEGYPSIDHWQVQDQTGTVIPETAKIAFLVGDRLFISLKAGIGA